MVSAVKKQTAGSMNESLLTWQFEANDLYGGNQTGRSVMEGFAGTLLAMMELIDPDMEE